VTIPPGREHIIAALPAELATAAGREAREWAPPPARRGAGQTAHPGIAVLESRLAQQVSPATLRAYLADWHAFSTWCSTHHRTIPPADAEETGFYLAAAASAAGPAEGKSRYRRATLLRWASSISAVHASLSFPDPCAQPPAREVIEAIRALPGDQDRRTRPLLADGMLRLLAQLPAPGWPGEPARRRDRLIVTLGFSAALSPSALTGLALADLSATADQHALTLRNSHAPVSMSTDPLACAACAYASWRELIDAADTGGIAGVRELAEGRSGTVLEHAGRLPGDAGAGRGRLPLLRRIRRGGTITAEPLTAQVITQVLRRLAASAGLDPTAVTGLSLRASGRLDHLLRDAAAPRP
jgi:integrase